MADERLLPCTVCDSTDPTEHDTGSCVADAYRRGRLARARADAGVLVPDDDELVGPWANTPRWAYHDVTEAWQAGYLGRTYPVR